MKILVQFLIGLLFGIGLIVAGMANPAKVLNFLDVMSIPYGGWDPSLAFVLAGASGVAFLGYRLVLKRSAPFLAEQFHLSAKMHLDAPIIVGPAIFGIGWGLSGFCPGPAFVALGTGQAKAAGFVIAMIAGMIVARWLALASIRKDTSAGQQPHAS